MWVHFASHVNVLLWEMIVFLYFLPFGSFSSRFWAGWGFIIYLFIYLFSPFSPRFRQVKECLIFPSIFGQFKPWIKLNFADIVNFVSLILCPVVFCLWFWPASRSASVYWKCCCFRFLFQFGAFPYVLG